MRIVSDPKHPHKEWYEELCALAAIGELSSSENEELQQHLTHCAECQRLFADFRRISADDLGSLAVLRKSEQGAAEFDCAIDVDEVLAQVIERAQRNPHSIEPCCPAESQAPVQFSIRSRWRRLIQWLQRPALSYGAVALLLCAVATVVGFHVREVQLTPTLQQLNAQVIDWKNRTHAAETIERSASELLRQNQAERENLQRMLSEAQTRYTVLESERNRYQALVSQTHAQLEQRAKELEAFRNSETDKSRQLAELESKLRETSDRMEQQDKALASLRSRLWDENSRRAETQNFDDADAKELFGARDLHIVDVYDVGSNGKTRRTYGRVYYVAKKLLIFYAFDLQDPRRNRVASGFQAWGYQQASDTNPRSLGLFSLDDVAENRWVLKVNNPRVLERIDAVFVTLEAPNGSPSPRGRRVLYANLAGPANHP